MLQTLYARTHSALLLTPAIMLLLYWIVRFAGTTENTDIHLVTFFAWTFAVSFSIAMIITLYVAHLCKTVQWE